jgi:hypothetical protein
VNPSGRSHGHRRADSLRVLRSQKLSGGSNKGPAQLPLPAPDARGFGAPIPGQITPYGSYYQAAPEPTRTPGPLLTAFLNMDLRILKASDAFRALFADGGDVRNRHISEFVAGQHEPALQRLQSDLRDERTRREPTFLPGIFPGAQEQDAVQSYDVEDVEALSHPYDDRSDLYTFVLANGRTEQIQVRVRLARTSTFFATIMLYRVAPQAPYARSAFAMRRQSLDPYSAMAPQASPTQMTFGHTGPPSPYATSTPGSPFSSLPTALMTTLPPVSSSISTNYSTSPAGVRPEQGSYFPRLGPSSLATASVPGMYPPPPPPPLSRPQSTASDSRPGTARERHRPEPLSGGGSFQLPPISAPTTPITSQFFEQSQPGSAGQQQPQAPGSVGSTRRRTPTADEDEEDSRKRRRLNITEIIEK